MNFVDLIRIGVRGLAAAALVPVACLADPLMTNTPDFRIPFVVETEGAPAPQGTAILFASVDGGPLEQVQRVSAASGGFDFSAPTDGRYSFAVRMADQGGQLQNEAGPLAPELEVIVDTLAPRMDIRLKQVAAGQVGLSWSSDSPVTPGSVRIEYAEGADGRWQQLEQATEPTGNLTIQTSPGTSLSVRAFLTDLAGNEGTGTGQVVLNSSPAASQVTDNTLTIPTHGGSALSQQPAQGGFVMGQSPFGAQSTQPSQSGRTAIPVSTSESTAANPAPPMLQMPQTNQSIQQTPVAANAGVPGHTAPSRQTPQVDPVTQPQTNHLLSKSRVFDIAYQVEDVGPSGVGAVELFVTENGGQQWFRYGKDADRKSPMKVDTRGEGTFGFAVRVQNGLGFSDPPPQPGEAPAIVVTVDQTPPTVRLGQPSVIATGQGQIQLTWQVTDKNPSATPVRLEYAGSPAGPWTPLFDWQQDHRGFQMPIQPGLPSGLYFRVLARDAAGNVSTAQTPDAVVVDQHRPRARLLRIDTPVYQ